MSEYISFLPEMLLLVMMTSVFVITFLTVLKIIKQTGLFHGKTAFVASLLISILVIAGCTQLLIMPNNIAEVEHARNVPVNYSLLPVLILTGMVIMLQLFIIAATTGPNTTNTIALKDPVHPVTKPKSPGRPKKIKPGRSSAAQKPNRKGKNEAKTNDVTGAAKTT